MINFFTEKDIISLMEKDGVKTENINIEQMKEYFQKKGRILFANGGYKDSNGKYIPTYSTKKINKI